MFSIVPIICPICLEVLLISVIAETICSICSPLAETCSPVRRACSWALEATSTLSFALLDKSSNTLYKSWIDADCSVAPCANDCELLESCSAFVEMRRSAWPI